MCKAPLAQAQFLAKDEISPENSIVSKRRRTPTDLRLATFVHHTFRELQINCAGSFFPHQKQSPLN